ncbi:hypothetical protein [Flaviflexus massiliensis]|nr:hypothetical protein [Flaviflexus massiliensis]
MAEPNPGQYRQGMGDTFFVAVVDSNDEADEFVSDVTTRQVETAASGS